MTKLINRERERKHKIAIQYRKLTSGSKWLRNKPALGQTINLLSRNLKARTLGIRIT